MRHSHPLRKRVSMREARATVRQRLEQKGIQDRRTGAFGGPEADVKEPEWKRRHQHCHYISVAAPLLAPHSFSTLTPPTRFF